MEIIDQINEAQWFAEQDMNEEDLMSKDIQEMFSANEGAEQDSPDDYITETLTTVKVPQHFYLKA